MTVKRADEVRVGDYINVGGSAVLVTEVHTDAALTRSVRLVSAQNGSVAIQPDYLLEVMDK